MRHMSVISSINDQEAMTSKIDSLTVEMGRITRYEEVLDIQGFNTLQSML